MFPHTHTYAAREIAGRSSNLLVLGSILPDLAVTGIVDDWNIGESALEFRNWLSDRDKNFTDLGLGMMLHEFPCGIDRFTHTNYNGGDGYAYANGRQILSNVSDCFRVMGFLKLSEDKVRRLSHNFIETGVEFLILKDNPELVNILRRAVDNVNIEKCVKYFSEFYGIKDTKVAQAFSAFDTFIKEPDYTSVDGLVEMWKLIAKQKTGLGINVENVRRTIQKSIEIVKPTYSRFISDAISSCKKDAKKFEVTNG
ncbi:MAG TPA: hypothetical protein VJB94_05065 [Candidatus Nanoarchaeia archaeon]|nr:hypothetical protein [Candidatus Nanoarchaeia archaeon]